MVSREGVGRLTLTSGPPFVIPCSDVGRIIYEPRHEKTCQYTNNEGADQPAHSRSRISDFVVRCLDSIIPTLAKFKISRP